MRSERIDRIAIASIELRQAEARRGVFIGVELPLGFVPAPFAMMRQQARMGGGEGLEGRQTRQPFVAEQAVDGRGPVAADDADAVDLDNREARQMRRKLP